MGFHVLYQTPLIFYKAKTPVSEPPYGYQRFLYSVVLTLFNNHTHVGIENFESADDVLMHLLHSYRDAMSVL